MGRLNTMAKTSNSWASNSRRRSPSQARRHTRLAEALSEVGFEAVGDLEPEDIERLRQINEALERGKARKRQQERTRSIGLSL